MWGKSSLFPPFHPTPCSSCASYVPGLPVALSMSGMRPFRLLHSWRGPWFRNRPGPPRSWPYPPLYAHGRCGGNGFSIHFTPRAGALCVWGRTLQKGCHSQDHSRSSYRNHNVPPGIFSKVERGPDHGYEPEGTAGYFGAFGLEMCPTHRALCYASQNDAPPPLTISSHSRLHPPPSALPLPSTPEALLLGSMHDG